MEGGATRSFSPLPSRQSSQIVEFIALHCCFDNKEADSLVAVAIRRAARSVGVGMDAPERREKAEEDEERRRSRMTTGG